ncbi:MAG TPA: GNAT family N-acetyltransferase [Frankiaceae bacterium]|nr:GNAT family N-acetyltransferase [Frankiaceae bacterium]
MTTDVRPLRETDVDAAELVAHVSIAEMMRRYEVAPHLQGRTPERVARGRARVRHLLGTDPGGAWAAVDGGELVGVGLASVRGPLWFLSLLAVAPAYQGRGVGCRLLEATLGYGQGCPAGWILASADPRALRRYAHAGFALHPGYEAIGTLDRGLVPSGLGVRDGDLTRDRELIEAVAGQVRGAPHGPDLDHAAAQGLPLLVVDGAGYAFVRPDGPQVLGARDPGSAQRLLWAVLAETTSPQVAVDWLTAAQQWAIEVVLAARLSLHAGLSSCPRGAVGPLTPYLPSGAYG